MELQRHQLLLINDLLNLCKEAINYEYQQGNSPGLDSGEIGELVYLTAVRNPILILETNTILKEMLKDEPSLF